MLNLSGRLKSLLQTYLPMNSLPTPGLRPGERTVNRSGLVNKVTISWGILFKIPLSIFIVPTPLPKFNDKGINNEQEIRIRIIGYIGIIFSGL
jgi:hypothetical protein